MSDILDSSQGSFFGLPPLARSDRAMWLLLLLLAAVGNPSVLCLPSYAVRALPVKENSLVEQVWYSPRTQRCVCGTSNHIGVVWYSFYEVPSSVLIMES